jgi:hypothetical protein
LSDSDYIPNCQDLKDATLQVLAKWGKRRKCFSVPFMGADIGSIAHAVCKQRSSQQAFLGRMEKVLELLEEEGLVESDQAGTITVWRIPGDYP